MATATRRATPRAIGKYDLLNRLGAGGAGTVYRGRDPDTGDTVAIKVVTPEGKSSALLLKRFEQEFRAATMLDHPHVVRGLDFGRDGDHFFLVMEFVDGPSLGDLIEQEGRLREADAVRLLSQIGQALHAAHERGIIHRDVKPDNILIGPDGNAKLTDLGLVKIMNNEVDLTRPCSGLGTPNFMAPEQFGDAKHADPRCDVYSLGATLYMAVTGQVPFAGKGLSPLKKKMNDDLTPPRKLIPALSEQVDLAIRRAVRSDPEQRFATCQEFLAALAGRQPLAGDSSTATPNPNNRAFLLPPKKVRNLERRVEVRFPSQLESACQAVNVDKEERWTGVVQDVSSGGIGLLLSRRFESGTVLTIEPPGSTPNRPKRLVVRVQRVQASGKKWRIGCRFARKLSEEEVHSLR